MPEVNPGILQWARETAGLGIDQAAEKLEIGTARGVEAKDRLAAYERGEDLPSRALLRRMAKRYRRPLVAFYLDHVPGHVDSGHDFRMLPAGETSDTDHLLAPLLRDMNARQSLLSSALQDDEDSAPVEFVASLGRERGVTGMAETIQGVIDFDLSAFRRQRKASEAFKYLRECVERTGVFVLLVGDLGSWHSRIDLKTFRGIALADQWAPFIVINANDARSAWSFTLLHELAHLSMGESGVSGAIGSNSAIERFCNDVASEMLMPADQMAKLELPAVFDLEEVSVVLADFSAAQNVSQSLLAYRLYRANRLTKTHWITLRDHFSALWRQQRDRERQENREKDRGGPDKNKVRRYQLGAALRSATAEMLREGALSTTKAAKILGMRPVQLGNVIELSNASG